MENNKNLYVPGVCNIGPAEIELRREIGWGGLVVTAIIWAGLAFFNAESAWYAFLVLPAAISATGFIQSYLHFCAAFGMRGLFNFSSELGQTESVAEHNFRAKDQRKAAEIIFLSLVIGILVAIFGYYLTL